jgi:glucan biosynthesis protein C
MGDRGVGFQRRNDIDWVRILAVFLLIPFHTARIFDTFEPFYVKNQELSPWLSYAVVAFLSKWQMPLLFFLAGASTWYSLTKRSGLRYAGERLKRLMVPFIFGTLVIVPPQMYFALLHHGNTPSSYLAYYPTFFRIRPAGMSDYTGVGFTWAHLWFILNLFVIALAALPVFLVMKKRAAVRVGKGFSPLMTKGPAIFLFARRFHSCCTFCRKWMANRFSCT